MKKILTALNSGSFELRHRVVLSGPIGISPPSALKAPLHDWIVETIPQKFEGGLVFSPPIDLGVVFDDADAKVNPAHIADWGGSAQVAKSRGWSLFLRLSDISPSGNDRHAVDPDIVTGRYRKAAGGALSAGLEGIEIDATSGTLLDRFMRSDMRSRDDYRGDVLENRIAMLAEVVDAVLSVWERERVCVRLSLRCAGGDPEDDATLIRALRTLRDQEIGFVHLECAGISSQTLHHTVDRLRRLRDFFPYLLIVSGRFAFEDAASLVELRVVDAVGSDLRIHP